MSETESVQYVQVQFRGPRELVEEWIAEIVRTAKSFRGYEGATCEEVENPPANSERPS